MSNPPLSIFPNLATVSGTISVEVSPNLQNSFAFNERIYLWARQVKKN